MWSCKSQQLFSSIKVLNLTIAADLPMAALVRSLQYFCFIKFAFVWGEIQVTICSHPRLVPCGLHNVEAPAETGFHGDGKGGLEGLVG